MEGSVFRYVLAWLVMALLAVANGALRESAFKRLPELRAHQLSTLTASIAIGAFIAGVVRVWPPASAAQAWEIGFLWLALTLAFEFGLGLFVLKKAPRETLR